MLIELSEQDIQSLLEILMNSTGVPWKLTHPLIMRIGAQQQAVQQQQLRQLQPQQRVPEPAPAMMRGNSHGDSAADTVERGDLDPERGAAGAR